MQERIPNIPKISSKEIFDDANISVNSIDDDYGKIIESVEKLPKEGYLTEIKNHKDDPIFEEDMVILYDELRIMNKKLEEFNLQSKKIINNFDVRQLELKIQELEEKIEKKEKEITDRHAKYEEDFEEKMAKIVQGN